MGGASINLLSFPLEEPRSHTSQIKGVITHAESTT